MQRQILGEGMSDLRQKPKKIKYNGTEYEILFTIEVMDKIEDTMGLTWRSSNKHRCGKKESA